MKCLSCQGQTVMTARIRIPASPYAAPEMDCIATPPYQPCNPFFASCAVTPYWHGFFCIALHPFYPLSHDFDWQVPPSSSACQPVHSVHMPLPVWQECAAVAIGRSP